MFNLQTTYVGNDMNRIPLDYKDPKNNGSQKNYNKCKASNITCLQKKIKKIMLEYTTGKEKDSKTGQEYTKCDICGEIFLETLRLVKHAIMHSEEQ